jgi:hypothetical protein
MNKNLLYKKINKIIKKLTGTITGEQHCKGDGCVPPLFFLWKTKKRFKEEST